MRLGGNPSAGVLAGAVRRDRGQPVLHRGDRPPPGGLRRQLRQRRRRRPAALRAARRRPGGDLTAAGAPVRRRDRVAAGGRGDRTRLRRLAAGAGARARRGALPGGARRGARRRPGGRVPGRPRPLRLLARPDPRDPVRGHVGHPARPDPPPGRAARSRPPGRPSTSARWPYHFTRAAEPEDAELAIRYALQAGEQATAMLAHEQAADHYARALEVLVQFDPDAASRRCDLLLALGEAQVRSGERPRAWTTFREAATLAAKPRRRRQPGPGGDRRLAPLRAASGGGRRGADRAAGAGAGDDRRRALGDARAAAGAVCAARCTTPSARPRCDS